MDVPADLRYSTDHEWISIDGNRVRVGITDYAQDALGDVVYVQVPSVGTVVSAGQTFSEVESTKSVSDVYAPVSGTIVEVNDALADSPEQVNSDPYGAGWLCVISPVTEAEPQETPGPTAPAPRVSRAPDSAEARLERVLTGISDFVGMFDRDWRCLHVDERIIALAGKQGAKVRGEICWEAFPNAVGTALEREMRAAVASTS